MNSILVSQPGGPAVLEVVALPDPVAAAGHLLVLVEAAGVNYVDVYLRDGSLPFSSAFTPGFEGVGMVMSVGEGVSDFRLGDRVAWINHLGSYAACVALPVEQAIRLPADFPLKDSLLFQAVTAEYLVTEYRDIGPGMVVLVQSAAGGVGQILVQWLKHLGATVIGTASTEEKLRTIRSLGADHAVNYSDGFLEQVMELTGGRGVDLVFDAVGATTFSYSVKALARRGMAVAYGQASGVAPDVQVFPLIMKVARVAGADIFNYIADPAEMQGRAAHAIRAIQEGWIKIGVPMSYALSDASVAHDDLEGRRTEGKLALLPN